MVTFAGQFAKISQAATKTAFETRFNTIQRGLTNRLNEEIQEVIDNGAEQRIAALQQKRDQLADAIPKIKEYQDGLITNANRFIEISDAGKSASQVDADQNDTLGAEEVETLNAAKAAIAENIRTLKYLYYDGVQDGNIVQRMRQDADRLDALTATVGTIDPAGTTPATNQNRELIDLMSEIQGRAVTFASTTNTLVESTNQMIIDIQKRVFDKETQLAELTVLEVSRQTEKIDDLKAQYGNLLKAISLSFEVQSALADQLAEGTQPAPEAGSILNLFI